MEEFKKIDWLPSVEDIIDDKFLNEERLQEEGSMYRILNGAFQDPFLDIRPNLLKSYNSNKVDNKATNKTTKTQPKNSKKVVSKETIQKNNKKSAPKKSTTN